MDRNNFFPRPLTYAAVRGGDGGVGGDDGGPAAVLPVVAPGRDRHVRLQGGLSHVGFLKSIIIV